MTMIYKLPLGAAFLTILALMALALAGSAVLAAVR